MSEMICNDWLTSKEELEMMSHQLPVNFTTNNIRRVKETFNRYQQIIESLIPQPEFDKVKFAETIRLIKTELDIFNDPAYPWRKAKQRFRFIINTLRSEIEGAVLLVSFNGTNV